MELRKRIEIEGKEREFIFFTVKYNHFRDVSTEADLVVRDGEEMRECECVLSLPASYDAQGEETPLILSFHGAGDRVCAAENRVGGTSFVQHLVDAGYAALDVCGSEPHGTTMGCPEHIFAVYKAYRYAIKHYNLSREVLVAGASMGGTTAMNFVNTFPNLAVAVGIFFPRLHMDGVTVKDHYCIGTWDKTTGDPSVRDLIKKIYRFKGEAWSEETVIGFNPHHSRSFVDADGQRVILPPCPVKIWQGTADSIVDCAAVEEYVRSVKRGGCYIELHLLEGIGHTIIPVMKEELKTWFDRFI